MTDDLIRGEHALPCVLTVQDDAWPKRHVYFRIQEGAYGLDVYVYKTMPTADEPDPEEAMCSVHVELFDNHVAVISYDAEQTRAGQQSMHYDKLVEDVDAWQKEEGD